MIVIKDVYRKLLILTMALVSFIFIIIPVFAFYYGYTRSALIFAAFMWPLAFILCKVIFRMNNTNSSNLSHDDKSQQKFSHFSKIPLSTNAIMSDYKSSDPKEDDFRKCLRDLSVLRSKTDSLSLASAVEYLEHDNFEVRSKALDVVSYQQMVDEKPLPVLIIKKITDIYNKILEDYDAGKISDEEVKEIGESCLIALFRLGGWNAVLVLKKQHIEPLKDYMNDFLPKENHYENYLPMKDPEIDRAETPPIQWLKKRDFEVFTLDRIEQDGVTYDIQMLVNKKQGVVAFCLNGKLCKITTRLIHNNTSNSGDTYYTCLRPESEIVLPGNMLNLADDKLAPAKFEYNENKLYWETSWDQMQSNVIYNSIEYKHFNCYLRLTPSECKGEFDISSSYDSTT